METAVVSMLTFLQYPQQLSIPIFQRRYIWEEKKCRRLLDNILRVGSNDEIESYLLGSIVYTDKHITPIGGVRKLLVIDGQQRLTTLSLLLSAFSLAIEEKDDDIGTSAEKLKNYYLFNDQEKAELRYKLLLTKDDKKTFIDLLEGKYKFPPINPPSLLVENHEFFKNRMKKVDLKTLYAGLEKLKIVSVVLDPAIDDPQQVFEIDDPQQVFEIDDPQQVFESLNSIEVARSQADRIRNYVLMDLEPTFQNRLYENYWFPMEQLFADEYAKHSDPFMRDYLTVKMGRVPSRKKVYEKFKEHYPVNENSEELKEIVKDILRYAKYYVKMVLLTDRDRELWKCFSDLAKLQADVSYPFLLQVYDDYNQGLIEKTDFIKILQLVESYIFRRAVCNVAPRTMNKMFAELMKEVDKNNYLESLNNTFLGMDTNKRYPKDSEFKEAFINKDVYTFINKRDYLLRKLETCGRSKEPTNFSNYTIEHIMPQNLTEAWERELGKNFRQIHQRWLHKIGNLTLTPYNSEYSDRPFKEKRDMPEKGLRFSPLYLNQSFANTKQWNKDAIIARAKRLTKKACKIWIDLSR